MFFFGPDSADPPLLPFYPVQLPLAGQGLNSTWSRPRRWVVRCRHHQN